MILGKYQLLKEHKENNYLRSALIFNSDGQKFFIRWIKGFEKDSQFGKILMDRVSHLKRIDHPSIPKIIEYGWDNEYNNYCIVYDRDLSTTLGRELNEIRPSEFFKGLQNIVDGLYNLFFKKSKIFHGNINLDNIVIDENYNLYLVDFGYLYFLCESASDSDREGYYDEFTAPEIKNRDLPKGYKYQYDLYSIGRIIEKYFSANTSLIKTDLVENLVDSLCQEVPSQRLDYLSLINRLKGLEVAVKSNSTLPRDLVLYEFDTNFSVPENLNSIESELNDEINKPLFYIFPPKEESENTLVNIISENFIIHALWIKRDTKFVFLDIKAIIDNVSEYEKFSKSAKVIEQSIFFAKERQYSMQSIYDLTKTFTVIQNEFEENKIELKKRKELYKELGFYEKLLNKELKEIENDSLRFRYESFHLKSDINEISFKVENDEEFSKSNDFLIHIDKSTPPTPEEFEYIIQKNKTTSKSDNRIRLSAVAYKFDKKNSKILFKDVLYENEKTKSKIFNEFSEKILPEKGYFYEDVTIKKQEKERQLNAIKKVRINDVKNEELIKTLFDSSYLRNEVLNIWDLEKTFQRDKDGNLLEYSYNQKRAIINALHRSPLSVIQGPPGTGKTTVITEIVYQINKINPDSRILITSQTNDAVDNVLENLLNEKISFVRLSSGFHNTMPSLVNHTFDKKIIGWGKKVSENAKTNWNEEIKRILILIKERDVELSKIIELLIYDRDWGKTKKTIQVILKKSLNKKISQFNVTDKDSFVEALEKNGVKDIKNLILKNEILNDWHKILNVINKKNSSELHSKLIDSIKIVGATTNHIASKKYSQYYTDFDYVIMDESSKATTSEALIPIVMTKKLVFIGDHRQLRPRLTSNQNVEKWLRKEYKKDAEDFDSADDYINREGLFEKLILNIKPDYKTQLTECRRMPEESVKLTSSFFYEKYKDEPIKYIDRPIQSEHNLNLKINSSIFFIDIGKNIKSEFDKNKSSKNIKSAEVISNILTELNNIQLAHNYTIGVISPYIGQIRNLKKEIFNAKAKSKWSLRNIDISTIDKFQGIEKDIIIFDIVRSNQKTLGFLKNDNRINVALSRHKKLLIIVGNYYWLTRVSDNYKENDKSYSSSLKGYVKSLNPNWIIYSLQELFK